MIARLGMVSDQKFYLDSVMVKPRTDVERIALHSDAASLEFTLSVDESRAENFYRPRYVYGLSDAIIDPIPNLVYDSRGQYIAESSSWWQLRQFCDWPRPYIRVPAQRLAGEYIFLPTNGYYHWLIEDLPVFLKSLSVAPRARVIIPERSAAYVREVAGMIDNEIVTVAAPVRIERLVMTGKTAGMGVLGLTPHPVDVTILREFFNSSLESGPTDLNLYLSRVGQRRSPANERDLQDRMEKLGFQVFDGTGKTLLSQVAMFSRAKRLVGLHGAALSNIVWARDGIDVCEIFSASYVPSCYSALTAMRHGSYTPVCYSLGAKNSIDLDTMERIVAIGRQNDSARISQFSGVRNQRGIVI